MYCVTTKPLSISCYDYWFKKWRSLCSCQNIPSYRYICGYFGDLPVLSRCRREWKKKAIHWWWTRETYLHLAFWRLRREEGKRGSWQSVNERLPSLCVVFTHYMLIALSTNLPLATEHFSYLYALCLNARQILIHKWHIFIAIIF